VQAIGVATTQIMRQKAANLSNPYYENWRHLQLPAISIINALHA
jgi:hypothetical protein